MFTPKSYTGSGYDQEGTNDDEDDDDDEEEEEEEDDCDDCDDMDDTLTIATIKRTKYMNIADRNIVKTMILALTITP